VIDELNITNNINFIIDEVKKLIKENQNLKEKLYEKQKNINDLQELLTNYQKNIDDLQEKNSILLKKLEEVETVKLDLEKEKSILNAELLEVKQEFENFKANNYVISNSDRNIIKQNLQQVITQLDELVD
jgi:chromosome segregation ATPase